MLGVVRDVRHASTLKSKHKYSGQADGIRDVKWSPTEGVDFAFGTDSGWIQRWDMRNLKTAKVKISAHAVTCNAIDWHPDGKHIASASADKTVRIWDFSTTRRQKAAFEIKTPHPVLNARWRPPCDSPLPYESGAKQCTQLVTSYDAGHPVLHAWDLRRPALPFRELVPYSTAPTDLLWHSQDLLWTVGRDGVFLQTDMEYAPKTISKRNLQALSVSPLGEINSVAQRRRRQRPADSHAQPIFPRSSSELGRGPEQSVLSRSWADDSLDHSFLSAPPSKKYQSLTGKSRAQSLSVTVSSNESFTQATTALLNDVLSNRQSFRPLQTACRGLSDNRIDPRAIAYLAESLTFDLRPTLAHQDFLTVFEELLKTTAGCYEALGLYRLAQSWRTVGLIFQEHLQKRYRVKQQRPLDRETLKIGPKVRSHFAAIVDAMVNGQVQSPISPLAHTKPKSSIAQQLAISDSASSQRTPQVHPQLDVQSATQLGVNTVPDHHNVNQLTLPSLAASARPAPLPNASQRPSAESPLTKRNLNGLQEQHHPNEINRNDLVRRWSVHPKEPLSLGPVDITGIWIPPKLQKHDSNESFAFLAESSESRGPSFPSSFNSNESTSDALRMVSERPSRSELRKSTNVSGTDMLEFGAGPDGIVPKSPMSSTRPTNSKAAAAEPQANGTTVSGIARLPVETLHTAVNRDIGPGSYPDENGISPLVEIRSPHLPQRDANVRTTAVISPRHSFKKLGVRDSSVGRSSVKSAVAPSTNGTRSLYLPEDDDVDIELGKPFVLRDLLQELVSNHAQKGNAQTAASLSLLLGPLLPRTHSLPDHEIEATVSVYMDCLSAAGFAQDEVRTILDDHLEALVGSGLQPLQLESVLETYHDQLASHRLINEAAALRKIAYPLYPSIYEQALKDNYIHLMCGSCGKPIVNGMAGLRCETCDIRQAHCPVCWCESSPLSIDGPSSADPAYLLTTCLLCNHSGHATCLQIWFNESDEHDGGCPTPGCLCDCVAGSWRSWKVAMAERRRRSRGHGRVKSDDWPVPESKAVERTRTVLDVRSVVRSNPST